jgi:hypothetical protein
MANEIFKFKLIKILIKKELIYPIIINSFFIGLVEKTLPPVYVYSINYKWDLTPPSDIIYPCKGHYNNIYFL